MSSSPSSPSSSSSTTTTNPSVFNTNYFNEKQTTTITTTTTPIVSKEYYNWQEIYPELKILLDNINDLITESETISTWVPWPEDHYTTGSDWTVFPFLHTFPASDISKMTWIQSTSLHCPKTLSLLKRIPNIRTALFSRLGPGTKLSYHTGWADLANYVLRCHINIKIPNPEEDGLCGLCVNEIIEYHRQGDIIVFDDSKKHYAFNDSNSDRIVLIVDILRPLSIPLGTAVGGHTNELDKFVSKFK